MKGSVLSFIGALVLLVVAFAPPVVAAAEQNENVHFGEHLLILLAGLLLANAGQSLLRHRLGLAAGHATWGMTVAGLGLLLFVGSQVPAFDAIADASMPIHMLQHLVILLAGGLMGTGILMLAFGSTATVPSRPR